MGRNAVSRPGDGPLCEAEGLGDTPRAHQPVGLDVRGTAGHISRLYLRVCCAILHDHPHRTELARDRRPAVLICSPGNRGRAENRGTPKQTLARAKDCVDSCRGGAS